MLTRFFLTLNCSPTRAMLMTGTDHHLGGFGNMIEQLAPSQEGKAGYEGGLNDRVAPLPALLRDAGYHTYMPGKWHLGGGEGLDPSQRGFEQSFMLVQACCSRGGPRFCRSRTGQRAMSVTLLEKFTLQSRPCFMRRIMSLKEQSAVFTSLSEGIDQ